MGQRRSAVRRLVSSALALGISGALLTACATGTTIGSGAKPATATIEAGDTTYVVMFREEADLAGTDAMDDWTSRGREVVRRLQATARESQAAAIQAADEQGVMYASLWIANAMVFVGDSTLGDSLARLPHVDEVWSESVPSLQQPTPVDIAGEGPSKDWALNALQVPEARAHGLTGKGITVGFIDTGAAVQHPAIADQFRGHGADGAVDLSRNWFSPLKAYRAEMTDLGGHGTSTTGLAVGTQGVAPDAQWIAALACSASGCPMSAVLQGMQFMLAPSQPDGSDPDPDLRPQIVNNSWVRDDQNIPLVRAARSLAAAGIFETFAAGNDGPGCGSASPMSEWPSVVSVGAAAPDGTVAQYSSRGPTSAGWQAPDVIAPGLNVWAPVAPDTWGYVDGTSFAAPLVAGVAALMLQANPGLIGRPEALVDYLRYGATPVPETQCPYKGVAWPTNSAGFGEVDASRSILLGCGIRREWSECATIP